MVRRVAPSFVFRDAQPSDKEEVLALTANTWEEGDYIHWVYDDWVSDTTGRFLVAVDKSSGRIAGIDKLSFLSSHEAWFEGLRVHSDFRGYGLARAFQTFMIEEARSRGAQVIRCLTLVDNSTIHRMAYRDGFSALFVVRHWKLTISRDMSLRAAVRSVPTRLREAAPEEAPAIYDRWQCSSSCNLTEGMANRNWSFSVLTRQEFIERSGRSELLVLEDNPKTLLDLPQSLALIAPDTDETGMPVWTLSHLAATGKEWVTLAQALAEYALEKGIAVVEGLLPDSALAGTALSAAGFIGAGDDGCLCLFELRL